MFQHMHGSQNIQKFNLTYSYTSIFGSLQLGGKNVMQLGDWCLVTDVQAV